jgi:DNA primase
MKLAELIELYFSDYRAHSTKDSEIMICCPFCVENGRSQDIDYKLGINLEKEIAHCHRCDWRAGGDHLFDALADIANVDEAHEASTDVLPTTPSKKEKPVKLRVTRLPTTYEPLWADNQDRIGMEALEYLLKRGITMQQIKKHRLGFCGAGQYVHRIIFPIFCRTHVIGFTARTFRKGEPKYLNSVGEKFLYNYPQRLALQKKKCLLVEGPIDVLSIEQVCSGKYDCIGRFGSSLTPIQLRALSRYKQIILWPDPDQAGVEGVIKVAKDLQDNTSSTIKCVVPDKDMVYDPGAMETEEIEEAIKSIAPWSSALISKLMVRVLF